MRISRLGLLLYTVQKMTLKIGRAAYSLNTHPSSPNWLSSPSLWPQANGLLSISRFELAQTDHGPEAPTLPLEALADMSFLSRGCFSKTPKTAAYSITSIISYLRGMKSCTSYFGVHQGARILTIHYLLRYQLNYFFATG